MKIILALVTLSLSLLIGSAYAKETNFNLKKGELEAKCVLVSDGYGYWSAWFYQLGRSQNFKLGKVHKSKPGECPPILEEGDICITTEDISDSVTVTLNGDEVTADPVCTQCTTTVEVEGTVINGSCKLEGDPCLIDGRQGIVKDGVCIDLVG